MVHPAAASRTILTRRTWRCWAVPRRIRALSHWRSDARSVIWNGLRPPPPAIVPPSSYPYTLASAPAGGRVWNTPGGIGEDGPVPPTIPESTKISLGQRLRERQRERWPSLATVQVRFRGRFAYVNGQLDDGEVLPLCRLRDAGSASWWGFAIYLASRDGYEDSLLPSGLHAGVLRRRWAALACLPSAPTPSAPPAATRRRPRHRRHLLLEGAQRRSQRLHRAPRPLLGGHGWANHSPTPTNKATP